jgi:signal transduction histidine kinase
VSGNVPDKIDTDKMRLEQILKNLISNAIKVHFSGPGGSAGEEVAG